MGRDGAAAGAVPEMVRKAFKLAQTERPGAVYLAVPEESRRAASSGARRLPLAVNVMYDMAPSASQIRRAARSAGTREIAKSCSQATGRLAIRQAMLW